MDKYGHFKLLPNFIGPEERAELAEWVDRLQQSGIVKPWQRDPLRLTASLYEVLQGAPGVFFQVQQRVFDAIRIKQVETAEEVMSPSASVVRVIKGGGGEAGKWHRDLVTQHGPQYAQLRFNILVSKSECGGNTLIEDELFEVNERDGWMFLANDPLHRAEPNCGSTDRTTISWAFVVKRSQLEI